MILLLISLNSFQFHVDLLEPGTDKNEICQLFGAFRVPIIAGFDGLSGIAEFD